VLTWGSPGDVKTALEELRLRALDATTGVPHETRQVRRRGNTDFERLLPGPDRMYPDTDSPPIQVTAERLDRIRAGIPEKTYEKESRYRAMGLCDALAASISVHPRGPLFERIAQGPGASAAFVCVVLTQALAALKRRGVRVGALGDDRIAQVFSALRAGRFAREAVYPILMYLAERPDATVDAAIEELGLRTATLLEVNDLVSLAVRHLPERLRIRRDATAAKRCVMGMVMQTMRGKFPGAEVSELVDESLKKL
jgi:glutamyl-tRNA(Gln) amidotransferase subunit E